MIDQMVYHPNNSRLMGLVIRIARRSSTDVHYEVMFENGAKGVFGSKVLRPVPRLHSNDPDGNMHTTN